MFCTKCGTQVDEGKNFCGNCGARIRGDAEAGATIPAAAPAKPAGPGLDKSIVVAAGIALVVIAGGAGAYFGTDMFRSGKHGIPENPGGSAATVGSSAPGRENPEEPAATRGAPPPTIKTPGRSAATAGAPAPRYENPGRSAATDGAPAASPRRTAEAGLYETVRLTTVYEQPSISSRQVASIPQRTRVNVVGSVENWLEVRSKGNNPPGFIRRGDAVIIERRG